MGEGFRSIKMVICLLEVFRKETNMKYGIYIDANGTEKLQEFKDGTFVREILLYQES